MPTAARPRVVAGLRLLALVGQGAEGEVWEARDGRGRRKALKLIRPDSLVEPEEVQRRGAWLVEVDHPALARVWRTGVLRGGGLDGWGFVEMAFVDGRSLQRAPAMADALERLEPLAEALDMLHDGSWSQGRPLVHRDVKPANLIQTPHGGLVLVDHSTLRALGAETVTRIGTPVFAAPEVMSGRMGPPADLYSFCATAVALLTGARGEALAALLAAPQDLGLPRGVADGLRQRPGERPRSCRAALATPGSPAGTIVVVPAEGTGDLGMPPAPGGVDEGHDGAGHRTTVLGPHGEGIDDATTALGIAGDPTTALDPPGWAQRPDEPVPVPGSVATSPLAAGDDQAALLRPGDDATPDATAVFRAGDGPPDLATTPAPAPPQIAAPPGPRHVSGWLATLAVLALALPVAALLELPLWPDTVILVAVVALVHLLCHALHGYYPAMAWVVPPLAWAFLLADRATAPGRRRDWARPLLAGALLVLSASLLVPLRVLAGRVPGERAARFLAGLPGEAATPELSLAAVAAGLVVVALCVLTARRGGLLLRLALLPLWAAGAVLLLAGGTLLAPLALLTGRAGALLRLLGRTLAGVSAVARPDAPARPPAAGAGVA